MELTSVMHTHPSQPSDGHSKDQLHFKKVMVPANWEIEMLGTTEGTISRYARHCGGDDKLVLHGIHGDLHQEEQRRLRVIVNDMSYLHDKLTEYFPSSFGKLMIKDFMDPFEVFYDDFKQRKPCNVLLLKIRPHS